MGKLEISKLIHLCEEKLEIIICFRKLVRVNGISKGVNLVLNKAVSLRQVCVNKAFPNY